MNQYGPARAQRNGLCDLLLAENDSQAYDVGAVPNALPAPKKDIEERGNQPSVICFHLILDKLCYQGCATTAIDQGTQGTEPTT